MWLCVGARPASAQLANWNPYSTTVYREGPGFRIGETALVFHPGIAVELGYDSNVFYSATQPTGAGLLRLRAHFDLATLPPQRKEGDAGTAHPKVDFRLGTQIEYREFLSDQQSVRDLRSVNVIAAGDLTILPMGPFTLQLSDTYIHAVDPRTQDGALSTLPGVSPNYTRNYNRLGLLATYRPGVGRFEVGLGDYFQVNLWDQPALKIGDQYVNEAQAFARYRFLPQTLGSLLLRVGYYNFPNNPNLEAVPVRAYAGVSSLITTWFGVAGQIGYGNSLHLRGPSYNNVLANAELRFFLPKTIKIIVGYDRDFYDSLFADYYVDDKVYVAFDQPLWKRLMSRLEVAVRVRDYEGLINPMLIGAASFSSPNRSDVLYELRAELSVRATSWLEVAASYNLLGDSTNFTFMAPSGAAINAGYLKHSVLARVDFAY